MQLPARVFERELSSSAVEIFRFLEGTSSARELRYESFSVDAPEE